jgi:hypothetical protein
LVMTPMVTLLYYVFSFQVSVFGGVASDKA